MAIDYSRFQLGVDLRPFTQGIAQGLQQRHENRLAQEQLKQKALEEEVLAGGRWMLKDGEYKFVQPIRQGGQIIYQDVDAPEGYQLPSDPALAGLKSYQAKTGSLQAELDKANQMTRMQADRVAALEKEKADIALQKDEKLKLQNQRQGVIEREYEARNLANDTLVSLTELENAMKGVETGKYAQLEAWAGKYLPGVDVADTQALQSLATQFALDELAKQSGTKTDLDFLKSAEATFQLGNVTEANKMIVDRMKMKNAYQRERFKKFQEYRKDNEDLENFEFLPEDSEAYSSLFEDDTTPQKLPPLNAQGWQLMEDSQGNKAYVGPNGEIEEVK